MRVFGAMLVAIVVLGSAPTLAQTVVDSSSLVGEWSGTATLISARAGADRRTYTLTIEKVEGGKVYGRAGAAGDGPPINFVGTLRGATFTFYTGRFETQLTVAGNRMYGLRRAGADNENVELGLDKVDAKK